MAISTKIYKDKVVYKKNLQCIAGCSINDCSNDLRTKLKKLSSENQIKTLEEYGFSEEEIIKEVKNCKDNYPDLDQPLYPYAEFREIYNPESDDVNRKSDLGNGYFVSYYFPDRIYYKNHQIEGVNAKEFEVLEKSNYAKDDTRVFYEGHIMEEVSPDGFVVIKPKHVFKYPYYYAKNKDSVFYKGVLLEGADPETFVEIAESVFADNNYGYYLGEKMEIFKAEKLANFLSSNIGGEELGSNYKAYDNKVYYWDDGPHAVPEMMLIDLDLDEIKIINTGCVWDRNEHKFNVCDNYAKDSEKVYLNYSEIKEADPKTFKLITQGNRNLIGKDKKYVFYRKSKIENADPETFEILSLNYEKDKSRVYYQGEEIIGANPDTFSEISNELSKDDQNYYWRTQKIDNYKLQKILRMNNIQL
jgi:hypothetical protein